jgi:hypothetical protein
MSRVFSGVILLTPAILGTILVISSVGITAESSKATKDVRSQVANFKEVISPQSNESGHSQPKAESIRTSFKNEEQVVESNQLPETPLAQTEIGKSLELEPKKSGINQVDKLNELKEPAREIVVPHSSPDSLDAKRPIKLADNYINESEDNDSLSQVTSVTQLSDVRPTDWAFEALRSLVERYGALSGYPDGTFRGNRAMTRYEFAAGLNAALNRINELIAAGTGEFVRREDLETLRRLQDEFATELASLRGRVDTLEGRTAFLEDHQFSTTTKLEGEIIFALSSIITGNNANDERIPRIPVVGDRVRLNLNTSFTGRDRLLTRLQAGNVVPFGGTNSGPTRTNEGRLEFDGDSRNAVGIGLLQYRFPVSPRTNIYLAAAGNGFVDLDASAQLSPHLDGTAVSLFGLRNPIYNYDGGTGFGVRHVFNDNFELDLDYLTSTAPNPSEKQGLFDGKYAALAQLIVSPSDRIRIGFTYINSYAPVSTTFGLATGGNLANSNAGTAVSSNAYGLEATFTINPRLAIDGWVGYSNQRYIGKGDAQVWNWAVGLTFLDLGKEGSIAGILVGMEPKVTGVTRGVDLGLGNGVSDRDTSLHVETFYKYHLSDNVEITPGLIWITAPNHNENNDDILIGVVRTVFRF